MSASNFFTDEQQVIIDEIYTLTMDAYRRNLASKKTANEMQFLEKTYTDITIIDKKVMLKNISEFTHNVTKLLQPNCLEGIRIANEQTAQIGKQQIADAIIAFFHLIKTTFSSPEFLVLEETAFIQALSATRMKRLFRSLNQGESY